VWWGEGEYELVETKFAPIYERLIERLAPQPGERVLDVATGTGAVAARAARAGADVTATDLAPAMIEKARRRPEAVDWLVGDAGLLPFADDAFDAVASNFGVVFAPDPERAAAELTRVCRGRIGITVWQPHEERGLWASYSDEPPPPSAAWETEETLRQLLGAFDVEIERGEWCLEGESAEALWDWTSRAFPPLRERLRRLAPQAVASLRSDVVALYERHRGGPGIRYPRAYLLAYGEKR
jgi:SAM-dependent methyltransferase